MHDLPAQWALQQQHARPVSGEELEAFGKKASALWMGGNAPTLTAAVVETVKHAGFSPEQVRRVVEFTNTDAYLTEFRKEGSTHKVINFEGGPANPAAVLQDLNDGGGGTVFDRGVMDYSESPAMKTSHVEDSVLEEMFKSSGATYSEVDPQSEFFELRDKVASLHSNLASELTSRELDYHHAIGDLYYQVKQAALQEVPLGDVLKAWQPVCDDEIYVKLAFEYIAPKLMNEGIFHQLDKLGESLEKTSSSKLVNTEHPLVTSFQTYSQALYKLAEVRDRQAEAGSYLQDMNSVIQKMAEGQGFIPAVVGAFKGLAKPVGEHAKDIGDVLMGAGSETGKHMGTIAHKVTEHIPHAAALYGGYRVSQSPLGQRIINSVTGPSYDPNTGQYY